MSTIEGGMVCTDDPDLYEVIRMFRSHGLVREARSAELRHRYQAHHPDLNPEFIFAFPAYNVRSMELHAIPGLSQLKRLDAQNELRRRNLEFFLNNLGPDKYQTDFAIAGSCNYALTLILKHANEKLYQRVMQTLTEQGVEFRRGTSGGGNQLRQPYLREYFSSSPVDLSAFPHVDHVHFFGFYLGNYPELEVEKSTHCAVC